jgi:hypothetical protein
MGQTIIVELVEIGASTLINCLDGAS